MNKKLSHIFILILLFILLWKGFVSAWSGLIASSGDILSTAKWNELVNKVLPLYSTGGTSGNLWVGITNPTARLHLKSGSATANTAPLKFTTGINLTTPESGSVEYDGNQLYFTPSTTRNTLAQISGGTLTSGSIPFAGTNGYLSQNNTNLYWDSNNSRIGIKTNSPNTQLDVNGDVSFRMGSDYSTSWTSNDASVWWGSSSNVRYTGTAAGIITGISGGYDGKILYIHNTSNFHLTLSNQSTSSLASNRIITGNNSDIILASDESATLIYDVSSQKWRVINSTPKRYIYRMTAAQASTSTTMANVTQLISGTLPVWSYKLTLRGKYRTAATTTGIWLTLKQQSAVLSDVSVIFQAQSATTTQQALSIVANGTSVTTTATPTANTDFSLMMNGTFNVSTAGTVAIQMKTEVAASTATLQPWTVLIIEPLY